MARSLLVFLTIPPLTRRRTGTSLSSYTVVGRRRRHFADWPRQYIQHCNCRRHRARGRRSSGGQRAVVLADAAPPTQLVSPEELRHFVRAQLTLQVDPEILDPFSTDPNRSTILRDRIERAI